MFGLIGFCGMDDFSVICCLGLGGSVMHKCGEVYILAFGAWEESCEEQSMILEESTTRSSESSIVLL